jgi:hypothetical protein
MSDKFEKIRIPQLNSYCIIFPDSCVLLNYIFCEEEFRSKVDFLIKFASGIHCEVLPKVNQEITKKLLDAADDYVRVLRSCSHLCSSIINLPLEKAKVTKELAIVVEEAFKEIYADVFRDADLTPDQKKSKARRFRVIEASIMLTLWEVIDKLSNVTLKAFFDGLEYEFSEKYIEFGDRQAEFLTKMNAQKIQKTDILETVNNFDLFRQCGVYNSSDVVVLNEALGRMYKSNKWGAVVTTDFNDMIKNRALIDKMTQLIVSDPLYCLFKLDKKIDLALKPSDGANKLRITVSSFFKKPNDGVV